VIGRDLPRSSVSLPGGKPPSRSPPFLADAQDRLSPVFTDAHITNAVTDRFPSGLDGKQTASGPFPQNLEGKQAVNVTR